MSNFGFGFGLQHGQPTTPGGGGGGSAPNKSLTLDGKYLKMDSKNLRLGD
jgi:hypothetical protein